MRGYTVESANNSSAPAAGTQALVPWMDAAEPMAADDDAARITSQQRRRQKALEIGSPLQASFIGILLLGRSDLAWALEGPGGAVAAPLDGVDGLPVVWQGEDVGALAAPEAAGQLTATNSIIESGELLDIETLTTLSGTSRLGGATLATVVMLPGERPPIEAQIAAPATFEGAEIDITFAGAGIPAFDLSTPELPSDEPDLGDIGDFDPGSGADDVMIGTPDNDTLRGGEGADRIEGLAGDDDIDGGPGDDILIGGEGSDRLTGGGGHDTLEGGPQSDTLAGGEGDDLLEGGEGSDTLEGGGGHDRLAGGPGSDRLVGGQGDDVLVVEDVGDVALEDDAGADGGGNDTLEVAPGFSDSLANRLGSLAPDGTATFVMGDVLAREVPDGIAPWSQQVDPDIENLRLLGDADHDVLGDDRSNELYGNEGDNQLFGNGGSDRLEGGAGDDVLKGGDGDDVLLAEAGDDMLYGEGGDDTFVLGLAEEGVATLIDDSGRNTIAFDGPVDPQQLAARLSGGDLVLSHDGTEVARIDAYTQHRDAFAGIEIDGEVAPLERFLATEAPLSDDILPQESGPEAADLLAGFINGTGADDAVATENGDLVLRHAFTNETNWARSGLHEDGAEPFPGVGPDAEASSQADLLASFLDDAQLWLGSEEQALYVPEAAGGGLDGGAAHKAEREDA